MIALSIQNNTNTINIYMYNEKVKYNQQPDASQQCINLYNIQYTNLVCKVYI